MVDVEGPEQAALRVAAQRDGVLTWAELQRLGVPEGLVRQRLRTGAWQRSHVGVFVPTPAVRSPLKATSRAALAAAWRGAVASHHLAGHLHRLRSFPDLKRPEVTVDRETVRRTSSTLVIHRASRVELTKATGLPATTVAPTLADQRVTLQVLQEMAAGWSGRPGANPLRRAVGLARHGSDSPLETGIRERHRQNLMQNAQWLLLRFTWKDVTQRPWYIVVTVRDALSVRGAA